jgi:CHAD domain-containing protein
MLKKKKQHEYIDKRCEAMLNCVSKFRENKDHEELHKLRVETKKLKAYAVFTSKLTGKKFKRELAPVTGIFKKPARSVPLSLTWQL